MSCSATLNTAFLQKRLAPAEHRFRQVRVLYHSCQITHSHQNKKSIQSYRSSSLPGPPAKQPRKYRHFQRALGRCSVPPPWPGSLGRECRGQEGRWCGGTRSSAWPGHAPPPPPSRPSPAPPPAPPLLRSAPATPP